MKILFLITAALFIFSVDAKAAQCEFWITNPDGLDCHANVISGSSFDDTNMTMYQSCDRCADEFRALPLNKRLGQTQWCSGPRDTITIQNLKKFKAEIMVTDSRSSKWPDIYCWHTSIKYQFNASTQSP